jgi:preprotein translocase subunit SecG
MTLLGFFVYFIFTPLMVLDCVVLVFLVLIQLPKKEAGAGLAFGGSATDALFGAGSGTVLTKITKYAATAFFVLAVILAVLQVKLHRGGTSEFERNLNNPTAPKPIAPASSGKAPAPAPANTPATPSAPSLTTNLPTPPQAETPLVPTNATPAPAAPK